MSRATSNAALPLTDAQLALVHTVTDELDGTGLAWLSGYAAGIARERAAGAARPPVQALEVRAAGLPAAPFTIVYGSQTGNARRIAERLAADAEGAGLPVRLLRADAYPVRELRNERQLYLVISTQGDGDPPDDARGLYDHLNGRKAPRLEHLHYAVLGLGDSSYPKFCAIGQALDARLEQLGARRLLPRADADLDMETVSDPWREQVLARARELLAGTPRPSATVTPLRPAAPAAPAHSQERPFHAPLLANQRITAPGDRDVRHLELSLEGPGLDYAPGDALGVLPRNPAALVDALLALLELDGDTAVEHGGQALPLRRWLLERRELTRLSRAFVAAHAERARSATLRRLLDPQGRGPLQQLLSGAQVVDLLQQYPGSWRAEALVAALRPLAPRLYSIASSRKEVGDEVHLTVAHVQYQAGRQPRRGAASHFLAASTGEARVPVYVHANDRFRLPADPARDIIMIGPGTGVAPFRAFVQERRATGAGGRNWLFSGNRHFRSGFLYQLEWQRALKQGALHRIDLAFSRDGEARTYVQHRIAERARALYDWLEGGAHLYVCGAIAMGRDVHAALLDAVAAHNGGDHDGARAYLDDLAREGRYARDVY